MSIDYFGSFSCKVRETIIDENLLDLVKSKNRVNMVLNIMRKEPSSNNQKPESEWTFKTMRIGHEGPQETEVRIADEIIKIAPLDALAVSCKNCPFNLRFTDFGCGGAINYPISARAERWLLSKLPSDLNSRVGHFLTSALNDFGYDGACIDKLRGNSELYEAKSPAERKWGGFFSKKTRVTSSQILHITFAVGSLEATHAKMVAYFLGFLNDSFEVVNSSANQPEPEDDISITQLKQFYLIAAIAGSNQTPVFIDA